jgi:hypothetical protein
MSDLIAVGFKGEHTADQVLTAAGFAEGILIDSRIPASWYATRLVRCT